MRQTKLILSVVALASICVGCATNSPDSKESSSLPKEIEARETLNSILFDQRTHFIENRAFTTSVQDLETLKTTLESPNYTYAMRAKPNKKQGISVTATPRRPNLRSFTGVLFALDTGKDKLMVSEICETTQPSKQAPLAPTAPKRPRDVIQCPNGSRASFDTVAMQ